MKKPKQPFNNQITIYQSPDGGVNIEVLYANENIWLTQKKMAELFEVTVPTINEHLANIFKSDELDRDSVIREFRTTAAEIITNRVGSKKDKIGLTSWRRSPRGKIMPSDVVIAKNYLDKKELTHLNRIGNMYLDYAEMQAVRRKAMTMKDWTEKLNAFLKFSEYEILTNSGKISHEVAEALALEEYEKFRKVQDKNYISDFDLEVKKLLRKTKT